MKEPVTTVTLDFHHCEDEPLALATERISLWELCCNYEGIERFL